MISISETSPIDRRRAMLWLVFFAVNGLILVRIYADADQQDSGFHYLYARWAWDHPRYFVSVWARPLFTLIYSLPAQMGYVWAKIFTVIISLCTAWETWRLARRLNIQRAALVIPLLILQPSFYLLFSVVLTETLFALLFVVALRLHLAGRVRSGALIASMLILVRPEGFFIGLLWGVWMLVEIRRSRDFNFYKLLTPLLLATGMIVWWAASFALTRDPLWIMHNWPSDWQVASRANGTGPVLWYVLLLPLIAGPFFLPQFISGLIQSLKKRTFIFGTASFLTLFLSHSVMYSRGWFGSAGYPRYLVCVAPAIAIISLLGWNHLADRLVSFGVLKRRIYAGVLMGLATIFCMLYVDIWPYTRDARAVDEIYHWFRNDAAASRLPVSGLITSQAYMRIVFNMDIGGPTGLTGNRQANLERIRNAPPGTLIFWETHTGPTWYRLNSVDFETAGFRRLHIRRFELQGLFLKLPAGIFGGTRRQEMMLYYRD